MPKAGKQTGYVLKVHLLDYQCTYLKRLQKQRFSDTGLDCYTGSLIKEALWLLQRFYRINASEKKPLVVPKALMAGHMLSKTEEITVHIRTDQHKWLTEAANGICFVSEGYITRASLVRLAVELLRERHPC